MEEDTTKLRITSTSSQMLTILVMTKIHQEVQLDGKAIRGAKMGQFHLVNTQKQICIKTKTSLSSLQINIKTQ